MQDETYKQQTTLSEELSVNKVKQQHGRARLSAMNMLSRREQSRRELANKLNVRFDQDIVDRVLDELQREGLQSDDRFVESFVSARVQRGQGPLKISYELKQKGICSDVIAAQLDVYTGEWLQLARDALYRKFGAHPPADHKEKQKRQRFVAGRGFPNDICYRLFD